MSYGMPYLGSKSSICAKVCRLFPKAENFYDLFGGGFSVTHFMLKHRSKDYNHFHFNEIRSGVCELIQDAIKGKYNYNIYSPPWVTREEFFIKKETDPVIKLLWSFGNNGEKYLFGKDIEQNKQSLHKAIVFNQFNEFARNILGMEKFKDGFSITQKRLFLRNRVRALRERRIDLEPLQQLEQLQRLERLQLLERLQRLQQLEQLHFYSGDYSAISIAKNSVIYCDIPYANSGGQYDANVFFNRHTFFDWADKLKTPIFISEYNINDNRFKQIASFQKHARLNGATSNLVEEKIYINRFAYDTLILKKIV